MNYNHIWNPFRPSDVIIDGVPPLVGTFGRVENEVAAACIVLACRSYYDAFAPVTPQQVGRALIAFGSIYPWTRNPFCRPDFYSLVDIGAAEWVGPEHERPSRSIALTPKGVLELQCSMWAKKK